MDINIGQVSLSVIRRKGGNEKRDREDIQESVYGGQAGLSEIPRKGGKEKRDCEAVLESV